MRRAVFLVVAGAVLVVIGVVIGQYLVLSDGPGMEKICGIVRAQEEQVSFQFPGLNVSSLNFSANVSGG
jgi:hypothetical protein